MNAEPCTVQPKVKLDDASRLAIVAAVAAGQSQTQVAKDFGIHRNTVWSLCNNVKSVANPANPFSKEHEERVKAKAYDAVESGLDAEDDPYKRAGVGLRWLEGKGVLVSGQRIEHEGKVEMVITWGQAPGAIVDVTPVVHKALHDGDSVSD